MSPLTRIEETYSFKILSPRWSPTVEEAYASIRRETLRRGIIKKEPSLDLDSSGIGGGFAVKGRTYRRDDEKNHLKCTHCGGTRHTKNECFKLVGYPEWWSNAKKKGTKGVIRFFNHNRTGRAAIGLSIDDGLIREEEREEGVALNNTTGNEERGSLSSSNNALREKGEIGFDDSVTSQNNSGRTEREDAF